MGNISGESCRENENTRFMFNNFFPRMLQCYQLWGQERGRQFLWGDLRERDHFEELGVDDRIILKWILKKWDGRNGLD
jgi:hypothetical protein